MKVFHSPTHRQHAPSLQFVAGSLQAYPEVPERVDRILDALRGRPAFDVTAPAAHPEDGLTQAHDPGLLRFLKEAHATWRGTHPDTGLGLIPDTFAVRSLRARPDNPALQAGYYCFETQTPLFAGTYGAALHAAWCALSGASALLDGEEHAYALCRPPGHHAGRDLYGGYCYLNNAALAACSLATAGRVAVLDIDFHHGNGTQDVFYERDDVDFVSVHAHPDRKYPYFSGREDETGAGRGLGHNRNLPLGPGVGPQTYLNVLSDALAGIGARAPAFIVVSLGVDTCEEDPLGDFALPRAAFTEIGRLLGTPGRPVLVVQEGGYSLDALGECVERVLSGLSGGPQGPDAA